MRIVLVGIDATSFKSPIKVSTSIAPPFVVPTPTDLGPLKYITSSGSDSNFVVLTGILIVLLRASTLEPVSYTHLTLPTIYSV